MSFARTTRRAVLGVARFWDDVRELEARRAIWNRPWDHDALHWSGPPGTATTLHGRTLPRRGAVLTTRRGWCACVPATRARVGSGPIAPPDP